MGLVYKHRDVGFTKARDALGLTDGNLASHAKRLEDAGLLEERRALQPSGFETRYRITQEGSQAFKTYLDELRSYLASIEELHHEHPDASKHAASGPALDEA